MKAMMGRFPDAHPRRGSVLIIFAAALVALMGFAALAVDLGAIYSAKTQLQSGADAAALAAIHDLSSGQTTAAAVHYAGLNNVMETPITLDPADVVTGSMDFSTGCFTPGAQPSNAVKVTAKRAEGAPDGPLPLFFANVLGRNGANIEAESIAALDGRVNGVIQPGMGGGTDLLPFAVRKEDVGHTETIDGNAGNMIEFAIDPGTGTVEVYGWVDLTVTVVGTQLTYGAGGPDIPVSGAVSIDNGQIFYDIPGSSTGLAGGETLTFNDVENARIAVKARARYIEDGRTLFDRTRVSNVGSPYVIVLRAGDIAPAYAGFDGQEGISAYLAPYMDPQTREITIGDNDVIFLFEYMDDLTSEASDFQDLVVLCTFSAAEQIAQSETRFVAHVGDTVDFYPYYDSEAPGNFGLLSLDGVSNSASTISEWIRNGYPGTFVIPPDPGYITLNGCPGVTTSIKQAVSERVGDIVLVTVYDELVGEGNNAWYRIPYFLALRIDSVQLTSAPQNRHITGTIMGLQTSNLITTPGAPEHASLAAGRLAR